VRSIASESKSRSSRVLSSRMLQPPQRQDQERPHRAQQPDPNRARVQSNFDPLLLRLPCHAPMMILNLHLRPHHLVRRSAIVRRRRYQRPRHKIHLMPFGAQHAHLVQNQPQRSKRTLAAPRFAGRLLVTALASPPVKGRAGVSSR